MISMLHIKSHIFTQQVLLRWSWEELQAEQRSQRNRAVWSNSSALCGQLQARCLVLKEWPVSVTSPSLDPPETPLLRLLTEGAGTNSNQSHTRLDQLWPTRGHFYCLARWAEGRACQSLWLAATRGTQPTLACPCLCFRLSKPYCQTQHGKGCLQFNFKTCINFFK